MELEKRLSKCFFMLAKITGSLEKKILLRLKDSHSLKLQVYVYKQISRVSNKGTKPRKLIGPLGFRVKGSSSSVEHRGNFPFCH